jgi:hypothetical protein
MPIAVREAALGRERDLLVRFCHDNLPIRPDGKRFDWLYSANPFGPAKTLVATEDTSREIVGIGSAFPRQLWIGGRQTRAWILGDFCIAERFRTLGPAVTLQRACMTAIPSGEVWYDFPSQHMLAVYKRLRVPLFSEQVRHVRHLHVDRKLGKPGRYLLQSLAAFESWRAQPRGRGQGKLEFGSHQGPFGTEFTDLDNEPTTHDVVRGARSAEYLNWRYRNHPTTKYDVVTARHGRKLLGYFVIHTVGDEGTICDFLLSHQAVLPKLLGYLIRVLVERDVNRLNASLLRQSALRPFFRRAGFFSREAVPVVVYGQDETLSQSVHNSHNWSLLHGDRES